MAIVGIIFGTLLKALTGAVLKIVMSFLNEDFIADLIIQMLEKWAKKTEGTGDDELVAKLKARMNTKNVSDGVKGLFDRIAEKKKEK